jgi:hypothetical protein
MEPSSLPARTAVAALAPSIASALPDAPDAQLRGPTLALARGVWATLAVLIVAVFPGSCTSPPTGMRSRAFSSACPRS